MDIGVAASHGGASSSLAKVDDDGVVCVDGGVLCGVVDVVGVVVGHGGASSSLAKVDDAGDLAKGISDLSPFVDAIESFISFLDSFSFLDPVMTDSLSELELDMFCFQGIFPSFLSSFRSFQASTFLHGSSRSS